MSGILLDEPDVVRAWAAAILLWNLLRKQVVSAIGDLREPSGVQANVRIVRFSWSTHFVAAFRRRPFDQWRAFSALLTLALRNEA